MDVAFHIVPNHAESIETTEGERPVAVLRVEAEGVTGVVESYATVEEAAAAVADLVEAEKGDENVVGTATVKLNVDGSDSLKEAEGVLANIVEHLTAINGLTSTSSIVPITTTGTADVGGQIRFVDSGDTTGYITIATTFDAIDLHSTEVSDDAWNESDNESRVEATKEGGGGYYAALYGWFDESDPDAAASYSYLHHFVNEAGEPGSASTAACLAIVETLNGEDGGDVLAADVRQGVYDHVANHLTDAEVTPDPLLSQEEYEIKMGEDTDTETEPTDEVEEASSALAEASTDDLLAEMARRWAEGTVAQIEDGVEAEVEVEVEMTVEVEDAEVVDENAADEPFKSSLAVTTAERTGDYDWEGVLTVEGMESGDGRMIEAGVLTWRDLPVPLMSQTVNSFGHEGAEIAGSINEIERVGAEIIGRGYFDSGEAGQELARLVGDGTMRGVSADIDSVTVEFRTPDGEEPSLEDMLFGEGDVLEVLVEGRIMGATATPFPAFQEAFIQVIPQGDPEQEADPALVASGAEVQGDVWRVGGGGIFAPGDRGKAATAVEALVASAAGGSNVIPINPPGAWFEKGDMTVDPGPFTVHADGRIYGLIARPGECHIGFSDRCVTVPTSVNSYSKFRNKNVLTAEGDLVATGPIFMDTVHPDLKLSASDAMAHYADTGCAVADVALYDTQWGMLVAGGVRPTAKPEQVRVLRGSDVSPDWRHINRRLECVALLSVNCSGFIVDGLVASAGTKTPQVTTVRGRFDSVSGEVTALVAAGMVQRRLSTADQIDELTAQVKELFELIRPIRAERLAARLTGLGLDAVAEHGCGGACGDGDTCSCES